MKKQAIFALLLTVAIILQAEETDQNRFSLGIGVTSSMVMESWFIHSLNEAIGPYTDKTLNYFSFTNDLEYGLGRHFAIVLMSTHRIYNFEKTWVYDGFFTPGLSWTPFAGGGPIQDGLYIIYCPLAIGLGYQGVRIGGLFSDMEGTGLFTLDIPEGGFDAIAGMFEIGWKLALSQHNSIKLGAGFGGDDVYFIKIGAGLTL